MNPSAKSAAAAVLRSPLLRFLILGGALFAVTPRPTTVRDIALTQSQLDALHGAQSRRMGHSLDAQEAATVDQRALDDEVLYREGLRLGLAESDDVVRQRIIQKTLFLAEELGGAASIPTENELRAYYERTRQQWQKPESVRFIHIFVSNADPQRVASVTERLEKEAAGNEPPALGDAFPLNRRVDGTQREIAAMYGDAFAQQVMTLPDGTWSEPIPSKYGVHLVKVVVRRPPGARSFEDVKPELPLLLARERKEQATDAFLQRAYLRYRIRAGNRDVTTHTPAHRSAQPNSGMD